MNKNYCKEQWLIGKDGERVLWIRVLLIVIMMLKEKQTKLKINLAFK